MLLRTRLTTLTLAACGIALGACSSATMHDSQTGAYVTDGAWVKSVENAPIDEVYQAAEAALRDLDMEVQRREQRALNANLSAEEVDGTNIKIDLQKLNDNSTRLAIKVGTFGDNTVGTMVLDKVRENLRGGTAQRPDTTGRATPAGFRERDDQQQQQQRQDQMERQHEQEKEDLERRQRQQEQELERQRELRQQQQQQQRDRDIDVDVDTDATDDEAWLSQPSNQDDVNDPPQD